MFYEAIFQPLKRMNYTTEAKRLAGKKIAVQDGWIIEDGPFKGQNGFYIKNSTVGWIPQSDLINFLTSLSSGTHSKAPDVRFAY